MSNPAVLTFVIVGHDDHPLFETDLAPRPDGREVSMFAPQSNAKQPVYFAYPAQLMLQTQGVYLHQFVLHAALDAVNEQLWTTTNMHLGPVDKFNNLIVTAYTTAAHIKFLLLHDGRSDDTIRLFFKDVYDIYVRVSQLVVEVMRTVMLQVNLVQML